MSFFSSIGDFFSDFGGSLIEGGAGLLGGLLGAESQKDSTAMNADLQREFAKQGIQWKVADAKKAGIHPLYALGAQTHSFTPTAVGDSMLPDAISRMGQSVGRAYETTLNKSDRVKKDALDKLMLEKASLENDLLRSQITSVNRTNSPPFPGTQTIIDGQGNAKIQYNPSEITHSRSGDRSTEAAPFKPAVTEFVNRDGSITVWPSSDAKQSIEDSLYEYEHMYRNRVAPFFQRIGRRIANFRPSSPPRYYGPR